MSAKDNAQMKYQMRYMAKQIGDRTIPVLASFNIGVENVRVLKVTRGIKHLTMQMFLKSPKDLVTITSEKFTESLALSCNLEHVSSFRYKGVVKFSFLLPGEFHKECLYADTEGYSFGVTDSNEPVKYTFGDEGPQILVAGASGSGKNYTANALLLSIARTEPKAEFVIIDPQNQFYNFDNWLQLAQPIASQDTSIDRNIRYVYKAYVDRHGLTKEQVEPLNRLVFVIDEFESKIQRADHLKMVNDIIVGGRKFKINVVAISQKPTEKKMGGCLHGLTQIYLGKVKDSRISADLSGQKGLQAHKLAGKGDFVKIMADEVTRFQVAEVRPSDYSFLVRGEKDFAYDYDTDHTPINDSLNNDITIPSDSPVVQYSKQVGRPRRRIEVAKLAYFLANNDVTVRQAQKDIGTNNAAYKYYEDFVLNLTNELKVKYNKEIC